MQSPPATPDNPVARLAASRAALVSQLARGGKAANTHPGEGSNRNSNGHLNGHFAGPEAAQDSNQQGNSGPWQFATQAIASWWQHHPLRIATDVARPYLSDYASSKPFQLIGLAAGLGALAVFIKPWRLVSVTGLAALAVKSSDLPATLVSFMTRSASGSRPASTQQTPKDPQ